MPGKEDKSHSWRIHDNYFPNVSQRRILTRSQVGFNKIENSLENFQLFADPSCYRAPGHPPLSEVMIGPYGSLPRTIITRSTSQHLQKNKEFEQKLEIYKTMASQDGELLRNRDLQLAGKSYKHSIFHGSEYQAAKEKDLGRRSTDYRSKLPPRKQALEMKEGDNEYKTLNEKLKPLKIKEPIEPEKSKSNLMNKLKGYQDIQDLQATNKQMWNRTSGSSSQYPVRENGKDLSHEKTLRKTSYTEVKDQDEKNDSIMDPLRKNQSKLLFLNPNEEILGKPSSDMSIERLDVFKDDPIRIEKMRSRYREPSAQTSRKISDDEKRRTERDLEHPAFRHIDELYDYEFGKKGAGTFPDDYDIQETNTQMSDYANRIRSGHVLPAEINKDFQPSQTPKVADFASSLPSSKYKTRSTDEEKNSDYVYRRSSEHPIYGDDSFLEVNTREADDENQYRIIPPKYYSLSDTRDYSSKGLIGMDDDYQSFKTPKEDDLEWKVQDDSQNFQSSKEKAYFNDQGQAQENAAYYNIKDREDYDYISPPSESQTLKELNQMDSDDEIEFLEYLHKKQSMNQDGRKNSHISESERNGNVEDLLEQESRDLYKNLDSPLSDEKNDFLDYLKDRRAANEEEHYGLIRSDDEYQNFKNPEEQDLEWIVQKKGESQNLPLSNEEEYFSKTKSSDGRQGQEDEFYNLKDRQDYDDLHKQQSMNQGNRQDSRVSGSERNFDVQGLQQQESRNLDTSQDSRLSDNEKQQSKNYGKRASDEKSSGNLQNIQRKKSQDIDASQGSRISEGERNENVQDLQELKSKDPSVNLDSRESDSEI